jgi:hypothetical protein
LIQFAAGVNSVIRSEGANGIFHEESTASPDTSDIGAMRPNVDTLYSRVPIDLSHFDVVLTVPEVPDGRYFVFAFYDLYVTVWTIYRPETR